MLKTLKKIFLEEGGYFGRVNEYFGEPYFCGVQFGGTLKRGKNETKATRIYNTSYLTPASTIFRKNIKMLVRDFGGREGTHLLAVIILNNIPLRYLCLYLRKTFVKHINYHKYNVKFDPQSPSNTLPALLFKKIDCFFIKTCEISYIRNQVSTKIFTYIKNHSKNKFTKSVPL